MLLWRMLDFAKEAIFMPSNLKLIFSFGLLLVIGVSLPYLSRTDRNMYIFKKLRNKVISLC